MASQSSEPDCERSSCEENRFPLAKDILVLMVSLLTGLVSRFNRPLSRWLPDFGWETALWMSVAERQLVRRADGSYHLLPRSEMLPSDKLLANQLKPCVLQVREDGRFVSAFTPKPSNILLYDRGDFALNEQALREALPKLYLSLTP